MPGCVGTKVMLRELAWVYMVVIVILLEFPSRDVLQVVNTGLVMEISNSSLIHMEAMKLIA